MKREYPTLVTIEYIYTTPSECTAVIVRHYGPIIERTVTLRGDRYEVEEMCRVAKLEVFP